MSILRASIKKIENVENLNLVTFDFNGIDLKMVSLGLGKDVQVGKKVMLAIKPSSVAIAKEFSGEVSYTNKIHSTIIEVNNGKLLSSIKLQANGNNFESLITFEVSYRMKLEVGDKVLALLKASELSISEIVS